MRTKLFAWRTDVHSIDRRFDWLTLIAGALTPLAFAPFGFFPLAILAPALLFLSWHDASPTRAARRGFLYGLGCFGVGVSWVYVSLSTYGNMPPALAALAVALFVAGLSLFPAALGFTQAQFTALPTTIRLAPVTPALWVLFEWVRGWFLTGFPWLNLGYSQTDTVLIGFAPWIGVYGISFAVAITAGLLVAAWLDRRRVLWLYLPLAAALWVAAWLVGNISPVTPTGAPLSVALVQANVPLSTKWRPDQRLEIVNRYVTMSEQAPRADLVVWPEAAVPIYFDQIEPLLEPRLMQIARERHSDFLLGTIERDRADRVYYNTVVAIGSAKGVYRKQHLVPFGEFLPFPGAFGWLIDHLQIPMSNFSRGNAGQPLLIAAGQPLGVSVCYEDAFGEEIIQALPRATLLVNVSEDAWFGDSFAPHQRLQMARVRARESGRAMLRAANTGPSAIIDHHGDVVARSPQFTPHVLSGSVQPMTGLTLYARYGNYPVLLLIVAILLPALIWRYVKTLRRVHE